MSLLETLRQYTIFNYAIFDIVISFGGIYLLSPILTKIFKIIKLDIPRKSWMYLVLPLSIISHIIVGTFTPMTKNFLDLNSYYVLKIVIIILFVLAIKNIKIKQ